MTVGPRLRIEEAKNALRLMDRQWPEEYGVYQTKDRRVSCYAQCQREDDDRDDRNESRRALENPQSASQIVQKSAH
jgi:hypothetical protein